MTITPVRRIQRLTTNEGNANSMQRLTLTEFIVTIALVFGAIIAGSWVLQSWLVNLNADTSQRMERAGRGIDE
jgi:hypothetical protein